MQLGLFSELFLRQPLGEAAGAEAVAKGSAKVHDSASCRSRVPGDIDDGLCLQGAHVPVDFVENYFWLNLAASRLTSALRERAVEARDDIIELLSPDELSAAQRRARDWDTAH